MMHGKGLGHTGIHDALHSPLFLALQSEGVLFDDHEGGCILYEKREMVESIMRGES